MNVLGLSAHFHDAAAAAVGPEGALAACAEERFTLRKHDPNFPTFAARACAARAGLDFHDFDRIVFYEEPAAKFTRVLASALSGWPASRGSFVRSMKAWLSRKLWTKDEISRRLDVHPAKVEFLPHHLSHAAQGFHGSGFDSAAILTLDAVGEWTCAAIARGRRNGAAVAIDFVEEYPYPHSLGLAYSTFTAHLGFRPNDGECSTMALAAFGRPTLRAEVERAIRLRDDGAFELDPAFFQFDDFEGLPWTRRFLEVFGPPRDFRSPLPFDCLAEGAGGSSVSDADRRAADLAASVQAVLEDAVLGLARRARRATGAADICLAGGVALNCVANARVAREAGFDRVFVPSDPGDGGAALGAAMHVRTGGPSAPSADALRHSPYLGEDFDETPTADLLDRIDLHEWEEYRRLGAPPPPKGLRLRVERDLTPEALVERAVDLLRAGKLLAWVQGRFEFGPRALGARSILAAPGDRAAANRLREHVKGRARFRPFALSVARRSAADLLAEDRLDSPLFRRMQAAARVREDRREAVRAALHADGTTRVQICAPEDNPLFHALLSAYGDATGGPAALLNTSLNEAGYPMAATPAHALIVFARTELDALALGRTLVVKESER